MGHFWKIKLTLFDGISVLEVKCLIKRLEIRKSALDRFLLRMASGENANMEEDSEVACSDALFEDTSGDIFRGNEGLLRNIRRRLIVGVEIPWRNERYEHEGEK